jgi:multidrug efflux system membrane fusion protein
MPKPANRPAVFVLLSLFLPACTVGGGSPGASPAGGPPGRGGARGAGGPVPVVTARAVQKTVPVVVPAVGTVEAASSVQIRSQVTGQLTAIHFTEGRDVRQGDPLFSLDPRPFQSALLQAQAVLARDSATLLNGQAQQSRNDALFQKGLLARDVYESQRASVASLAATVEADKAAVETARLNLKYTDITAPISGRTGALGAHVGDLVRANDTTPLVVINQTAPIYVTFSVPGRFLSDIRRYQSRKPLSVIATPPQALGDDNAAPAGNGQTSQPGSAAGAPGEGQALTSGAARGVLTFIDNAVDSTTAMIRLKATFPNSDAQLWPGAFVQVALDLTMQADAVVVPSTAVQASQDGQYVYLVKADRTVEMRPVRVERLQGSEAVIASGVAAGDIVVTDGHLRLTPGARVSERGATGSESGPAPPGAGARGAGPGEGRGPGGDQAGRGR